LEDVRNIAFQGRRPVLTLPWKGRAYGRDGIKKGFKQIRLEIFSLFLLKPASARKGAANAAERSAVNIKIPSGNSISSAEGWFACFPFAKQISGINLPRRGRRATKWRLGLGGADIFLDHSGSTYIIPKLSLYSTGLMPPKVILIRSSLYQ